VPIGRGTEVVDDRFHEVRAKPSGRDRDVVVVDLLEPLWALETGQTNGGMLRRASPIPTFSTRPWRRSGSPSAHHVGGISAAAATCAPPANIHDNRQRDHQPAHHPAG
jgi:hypothetical protein